MIDGQQRMGGVEMTGRRALALLAVTATAAGVIGVTVAAARAPGSAQPAPARSSARADPVRVVVPGRPGESATITDSDRVRPPAESTYNPIDVAFVQMMIVHHGQALTMADLATGRAADAQVTAIARRIRAAQEPEITRLRAWLSARGLADAGPVGQDHASMPGMADGAALTALGAARGSAFDRRFVAMMTAHHRGALRMADDVLAGGTDQSVAELANELAAEQSAEIRRMAELGVS
jgi:uncharacterized protein (DUF305 family)